MLNSKYLIGYHLLKQTIVSVGEVVEEQQFLYIGVEM